MIPAGHFGRPHTAEQADAWVTQVDAALVQHYKSGWRWGFVDGLVFGCCLLAAALCFGQWLGA